MTTELIAPVCELPTDPDSMADLIRSKVDFAGLTAAIADAEKVQRAAWDSLKAARQRLADHEASEPAPEAEPNGLEIWSLTKISMQGALPSYERSYNEASASLDLAKRALGGAYNAAMAGIDQEILDAGKRQHSYAYHRAEELRQEMIEVRGGRWPGSEKVSHAHRSLKAARQLLQVR